MVVEVLAGLPHQTVEFDQAMEHPALQLRHLDHRQSLGVVEILEIAEQETQGIAQPAITVGLILQNFAR